MSGPAATSGSAEDLAAYLDRAAGGDSNRELAQGLLEAAVRHAGVGSAALYLRDDGVLLRELAIGEGRYPLRLAAEERPGGMNRLSLAGGELLTEEAPRDGWEPALLLPLAAAVRSLVLE